MTDRGVRVLIIEDEEGIRRTLADFLTGCGLEVEEAADAVAGLAAARERPPSVVLLDLNLPGLSGAEVIPVLARQAPGATRSKAPLPASAQPSNESSGRATNPRGCVTRSRSRGVGR